MTEVPEYQSEYGAITCLDATQNKMKKFRDSNGMFAQAICKSKNSNDKCREKA